MNWESFIVLSWCQLFLLKNVNNYVILFLTLLYNLKLADCHRRWEEYLHHRNWQALQMSSFSPKKCSLNIYQNATANYSKHNNNINKYELCFHYKCEYLINHNLLILGFQKLYVHTMVVLLLLYISNSTTINSDFFICLGGFRTDSLLCTQRSFLRGFRRPYLVLGISYI